MKRELVALLLLSYGCLVTVYVLWPFFTVPWVGLQCVIVFFPDHTHLIFNRVTIWYLKNLFVAQSLVSKETLNIVAFSFFCIKVAHLFQEEG